MKNWVLSLIAFFFGLGSLYAQNAGGHVEITTFTSTKKVAPGNEFWLGVKLKLDSQWHVQSHWPSSKDYADVATKWKFSLPEGFKLVESRYPKGEEEELLGESLRVYTKQALIGAKIKVSSKLAPGKYTIASSLRTQACNNQSCQTPEDTKLPFEIEVAAGADSKIENEEIFSTISKLDISKPTAANASTGDKKTPEQGLLLTLLGVFVSGLLLNLTPCVYPVIAITIGFFSRQAGTSKPRRRLLALLYGIGIGVTFTTLFILASLAGVGFGAWLQNPFVLLAFGILVAAFAFSYFGLYQIQPPMWLMSKIGGGKTGAIGSLLMGLTMGITAAPCVGPLILGLIIQVAKEGSLWSGLLWGGSLSVGLALPYVFLGFFSGSVSALPKAGDWTEWMERLLGFLLLAVAIWFVNPLLPEGWLLPMMSLLLVVAAVWLGFIEKSGRSGNRIWFARGAVFSAALLMGISLFLRSQEKGIEWEKYTPAAYEKAIAEHKPILIDITAGWCVPCQFMEQETFKNAAVLSEASRFARFRVDVGHESDADVKEAVKRLGVEVQGNHRLDPPQIIFIDSQGHEMSELRTNEFVNARTLLSLMQQVK